MENRKSFLFYRSFVEAGRQIPEDKRLAYYEAIFTYALDGIKPDPDEDPLIKIAFSFIEPLVEASLKKYENGKKGGAPVGNQNARKNNQKQPKNNQETTENNQEKADISVYESDTNTDENNQKTTKNNQETTENKPKQGNYNYNYNSNDNYNKRVKKREKREKKETTKFGNFETREYDFSELEHVAFDGGA